MSVDKSVDTSDVYLHQLMGEKKLWRNLKQRKA